MECKLCKAKPWVLIQAIRRGETINGLIVKPESISCVRTTIVSLYRKKQWFSLRSVKCHAAGWRAKDLFSDLSFAAAFACWRSQLRIQAAALVCTGVALAARNFGRESPNLFSIPAKVAVASRYPPRWSGLTGGRPEIRDLGWGSEPEGLLVREKQANIGHIQLLYYSMFCFNPSSLTTTVAWLTNI